MQNNPPIFVSRLVGYLTASYAKPGDVLFYQEEVGSDLYFMVTGKVNLFVTFSVRTSGDGDLVCTSKTDIVLSDVLCGLGQRSGSGTLHQRVQCKPHLKA